MKRALQGVFWAVCISLSTLPGALSAASWQTYEIVDFAPDKYFDGDSFQLTVRTKPESRPYTYIFRLYGTDCPEVDREYPDRVAKQAKAFGTTDHVVLRWGNAAKAAVSNKLAKAKTIVVETKKSKARGASSKNRYYARVYVDGEDLAEWLISQGFARSYGYHEEYPKEETMDRYRRKLDAKERTARSGRVGIWAGK